MTQTSSSTAPKQVPATTRSQRTRSFDIADFPAVTGREEEWRFSPVKKLDALLQNQSGSGSLGREDTLPEGVTVEKITLERARELGAVAPEDLPAVVAANQAEAVTHYSVEAGAEISEPVRIDLTGEGGLVHGHTLVTVGDNAHVDFIVTHKGAVDYSELITTVVGDGANVDFIELQLWDDTALHAAQHDAVVGKDAYFKHVQITLGGKIVRLNTNVRYSAPGGEAEMYGLYFADAGQHFEHRTYVDHNTPKAVSNVLYKGALYGKDARTVWIGDVLIRPEALGIDTYEMNRNLLLSKGARADSVPNLEIETGEIEGAGHASSTGQFDEEHLFYLMSRGIPEDEARRLVVRGFFNEIIQKIENEEVEDVLNQKIEEELARSMAE